jgi:enoyl-CoA hydratase
MLLESAGPEILAITLDRPPANAIAPADIVAMREALASAAGRCRVLLLRAKGRFFCAGADVSIMKGEGDLAQRADRLATFARSLQELCDAIEAFPAPTIAVLDGTTLGGGLELALACDFRIASAAISLGLPETKLGLIPGAGGTQRVTRAVGRARALDLVLTGRMVTAAEAQSIGLIHEAVAGSAEARALELAAQLAGQPVRALQEAKRCISLAGTAGGFAAEIEATRLLHQEPETVGRIEAFLSRSKTRS